MKISIGTQIEKSEKKNPQIFPSDYIITVTLTKNRKP